MTHGSEARGYASFRYVLRFLGAAVAAVVLVGVLLVFLVIGALAYMSSDTLADPNNRDLAPRWSPDGRRLAFVRAGDDGSHLYVMDADGAHEERLLDGALAYNGGHAWSPDGRWIVAASVRDRIRLPCRFCNRFAPELYLVRADGEGEPLRLTWNVGADVQPDWSPDGREIAFVSGRDRGYERRGRSSKDVYAMTVRDGRRVRLRRITDDPLAQDLPRWSADRRLVFGGEDIRVVQAGQARTLELPRGSAASWAGDTRLALWDGDRVRVVEITSGRTVHAVRVHGIDDVAYWSWSTTAGSFAYVSHRDRFGESCPGGSDCFFHGEIYVVRLGQGPPRRLTRSAADDTFPSWSPDGRRIAFTCGKRICVMNADGGGVQRLTDP